MTENDLQVNTVFVFSSDNNQYGNPVGIIMNTENKLTNAIKLTISKELGYSETVFIEDIHKPTITIFNPQEEVNFAGHAVLGTYWFFDQILKKDISSIKCKTSVINCTPKGVHWITASYDVLPTWNLVKLNGKDEV